MVRPNKDTLSSVFSITIAIVVYALSLAIAFEQATDINRFIPADSIINRTLPHIIQYKWIKISYLYLKLFPRERRNTSKTVWTTNQ